MVYDNKYIPQFCWIDDCGGVHLPGDSSSTTRSMDELPPIIIAAASTLQRDNGLHESIISSYDKYGILLTSVYGEDWIIRTAKAYSKTQALSHDAAIETFHRELFSFAQKFETTLRDILSLTPGCAQCYDLQVWITACANMKGYEFSVFIPFDKAIVSNPIVMARYYDSARVVEKKLRAARVWNR